MCIDDSLHCIFENAAQLSHVHMGECREFVTGIKLGKQIALTSMSCKHTWVDHKISPPFLIKQVLRGRGNTGLISEHVEPQALI